MSPFLLWIVKREERSTFILHRDPEIDNVSVVQILSQGIGVSVRWVGKTEGFGGEKKNFDVCSCSNVDVCCQVSLKVVE
jgi:hypothetical protein